MPHILTDVKEIQRLIKEGKIIHRQGSGDHQTTRHVRESDMIPIEWCLSVGHRFELIPGSLMQRKDQPSGVKAKLKLYVWTEFSPDFTSGLAFAIANDEGEARRLVEKQRGFEVHEWGNLEVRRIDKRVARCVSGGG